MPNPETLMKPRHQAQCAAGNQPVTAPARFPFLLALLWLTLSGCDNASRNAPSEATPPPRASNVPLRIQIVSEVTSPDIIQRQWLSGSEQPIDIQPRNVDDFLAAPACEADIVIFPARLIGELVAKDWIVKLPALDDEELQAVDRGSPRNFPAAWQAQCNYGGVTYAIPLGCSIAQFVASDTLADQLRGEATATDPLVTWDALATMLPLPVVAIPTQEADDETQAAQVDRNALVDRFLSLAFANTPRNTQYGVLLNLETMEPRLTEPEFVLAAEWLQRLASQKNGIAAVTGSHASAWQWACENPQSALALACTSQLTDSPAKLTSGKELNISGRMYINVGGGLIAALASNCRQSLQSTLFLKWLTAPQTSSALAPLMVGVDPGQPLVADATAWRLQQNLLAARLNDQLPQELRIPLAHELRRLLADELLLMLNGSKPIVASLTDAQKQWQSIIKPQREMFRIEYRRSLGLQDVDAR